jgi:hypothetical protein
MDHDRRNASTPATRCATGIMPVAVAVERAADRYTLICDEPTNRTTHSDREQLHAREAPTRCTRQNRW